MKTKDDVRTVYGSYNNFDLQYLAHAINDNADILKELVERIEKLEKEKEFAKWVASEIFDDMWEYNKDAFAEIACRKLAKLGIVREKGDVWEFVEPQESEG